MPAATTAPLSSNRPLRNLDIGALATGEVTLPRGDWAVISGSSGVADNTGIDCSGAGVAADRIVGPVGDAQNGLATAQPHHRHDAMDDQQAAVGGGIDDGALADHRLSAIGENLIGHRDCPVAGIAQKGSLAVVPHGVEAGGSRRSQGGAVDLRALAIISDVPLQ